MELLLTFLGHLFPPTTLSPSQRRRDEAPNEAANVELTAAFVELRRFCGTQPILWNSQPLLWNFDAQRFVLYVVLKTPSDEYKGLTFNKIPESNSLQIVANCEITKKIAILQKRSPCDCSSDTKTVKLEPLKYKTSKSEASKDISTSSLAITLTVRIQLTLQSIELEIITNNSHCKPSGKPFGINICCGQPQPQKLNSNSCGVPATGRFSSKLRKVRSNGMVTLDSVERRLMTIGWPRSSIFGPKKIRIVPKRCTAPKLFTFIVSSMLCTPIKISINRPAICRCRGINKENCSLRPKDIGMRRSGKVISLTGMRFSARSPNLVCTSVPIGRYRSVKNLSGTSNTVIVFPFSIKTGSLGCSKSNNKSFLLAIIRIVSSLINSGALQCDLHDVYQHLRWPCWELRNSSNCQRHAVPSDQRDNPLNDDRDRDDLVHRNKKRQYCNCPPNLDQSRNSKHFDTITNKTHLKPSGKPFGISKYSGQPQPQKLNSPSSGEPAGGRFSSKLRKVRANGTVIEDSVERRRMVFMPGFTKRNNKL
uniref:Uncharacterized protein n=1 Tax=Glossina austeni TaxID=7395 RepID=A0A1A9VT94_GLOAU